MNKNTNGKEVKMGVTMKIETVQFNSQEEYDAYIKKQKTDQKK
jgi:hypothetical protein